MGAVTRLLRFLPTWKKTDGSYRYRIASVGQFIFYQARAR